MRKALLVIFLMMSKSAFAQNEEAILGCWEMKSRPGEALQLMRNGDFTFQDYNSRKGDWDNLNGTWDYKSGKLTLLYADRTSQTFTAQKAGRSIILTKAGGFRMTKADPSACGQ